MTTMRTLADRLGELDQDLPVVFGGDAYREYPVEPGQVLVPGYITSYRGYYDRPAITIDRADGESSCPRVRSVRREVEDAIGARVAGWKGGEYVLEEDKPVYAADAGDSTNLAILDVVVGDGRAILVTYDISEY